MNTDLNRERRLRRQAEKVVIAGYNHYDNLLTVDEAEQFVEAC